MAGVVGPFQLHRRDPIHCFEYGSSCLLIVEVLWSISFKTSFQELARGTIPQSSAPVCTLAIVSKIESCTDYGLLNTSSRDSLHCKTVASVLRQSHPVAVLGSSVQGSEDRYL